MRLRSRQRRQLRFLAKHELGGEAGATRGERDHLVGQVKFPEACLGATEHSPFRPTELVLVERAVGIPTKRPASERRRGVCAAAVSGPQRPESGAGLNPRRPS